MREWREGEDDVESGKNLVDFDLFRIFPRPNRV
jgi:hypothetical protein